MDFFGLSGAKPLLDISIKLIDSLDILNGVLIVVFISVIVLFYVINALVHFCHSLPVRLYVNGPLYKWNEISSEIENILSKKSENFVCSFILQKITERVQIIDFWLRMWNALKLGVYSTVTVPVVAMFTEFIFKISLWAMLSLLVAIFVFGFAIYLRLRNHIKWMNIELDTMARLSGSCCQIDKHSLTRDFRFGQPTTRSILS